MDRNWVELLQELRVTQTAVQILGGFLLALALQPRFAGLSAFQRGLCVGLMTLTATTIVGGLAPVYLHRALFRKGRKLTVVAFGHWVLKAQLIAVVLIVLGTVLLVLDLSVGGCVVLVVAAALGAAVLLIAASPVVLTRRERKREQRREAMPSGVSVN